MGPEDNAVAQGCVLSLPHTRKTLSADGLYWLVAESFADIEDSRPQPQVSLKDTLLSGFALFSLKDPSLLLPVQKRSRLKIADLWINDRTPIWTNVG